jgi:hypothetical protein
MSVRVTVDNFKRAESHHYFKGFVGEAGVGVFGHRREPAAIDRQDVIRMNRDTLYSAAVCDLNASPATVSLPDAGARFMSMQVVNEDHYTITVIYGSGAHTFTREQAGTRYVLFIVRTFVDPTDASDLANVHALQDAILLSQTARGVFETPDWDHASLDRMRTAPNAVTTANGGIDSARMFGSRDRVDPVQHLLGTAAGWGGNPVTDAYYTGAAPDRNDGNTVYRLSVKDVPVDGFWSISVYNKDGFFEKNALNVYSVNNVTARRDADGSVTVQFGGCPSPSAGTGQPGATAPNCIPITSGWNYVVRMYRPRKEILDGTWKFPEAVVVA